MAAQTAAEDDNNNSANNSVCGDVHDNSGVNRQT